MCVCLCMSTEEKRYATKDKMFTHARLSQKNTVHASSDAIYAISAYTYDATVYTFLYYF